MLAGQPFVPDKELRRDRMRARKLLRKYNQELSVDNVKARRALLVELLGGVDDTAFIEAPFWCDYGGQFRL